MAEDTIPRRKFLLGAGIAGTAVAAGIASNAEAQTPAPVAAPAPANEPVTYLTLSALEAAPHENVALLGIEPSIAKQQVRLTAEARDPEAMLDYVAALQADPRLSQVVLVSHQVQTQAAGKPVRFQMQSAWGVMP